MTEYRFTGEYVLVHFTSNPDWSDAMKLVVYDSNREDAVTKAKSVLGEPGTAYRWSIRWNSIEEIR